MTASDAAPLLLLPGTLCDARLFAPMLELIDHPATVPALAGASSVGTMAQLLLAEAPPRFSLAGFSLGAIVALEIIARAPERVERLALIGCNAGALSLAARAARAAIEQAQFLPSDAVRELQVMAEATPPDDYRQQTDMTLWRSDSRPRLKHIDVPTLVLCGEADSICPPDMSREIAASIANSRLVIVPDAGHYLPLERPDIVAAEMISWLATPPLLMR